ncbi:hypothetical protein ACOBWA_08765 [Psychrobacter sp. ER1]|uniref:hypothetical protein n=1 Tax=Psychrobacter sp. ER1 TaxID=3406645 RepID=UPI003B43AD7F
MAFTRLLLTKPDVFLLDEPTASMDNRQEQRCLQVLRQELTKGQTFIVSTHKTALLDLVDRLIIMDNQRIIIDGPKQAVLDELRKNDQAKNKTTMQQKGKIVNKANQPSKEGADENKPATSRVRNISVKPISAKHSTDDQGK